MTRYYGLAVVSGCLWGVAAYFLSLKVFDSSIVGGMLASPFIGLAVGRLLRPTYRFKRKWQALLSLPALYLAAALFGLAVGAYEAFWVREFNRPAGEVIFETVLAWLWGLTFLFYFVALWPLAFLNHRLLGRHCRLA
ncbi:MAG TPA: hypothetical protein VIP46_05920 [Pyrinomonadaceae bacterium]